MNPSVDTSTATTTETGFGAMSTARKARYAGFALAAVAIVALNLIMTPFEVLSTPVLGWFTDFGVHQVHDVAIGGLLWFAIILPLALVLYRPSNRVNTVLAPVIALLAVAGMALAVDSPLAMGFLTSGAISLVVLALHPAGRSLLRVDRVERIDRRVAALFAVGAVPLLAYSGLELTRQFGPADDHVLFVHYGAMAIGAFLVVLLGALAVVRQRDWRFAAWFAGVTAAYVGVVSVVYPTIESSLGLIGGALLVLWAVAFVASVESTRRRSGSGPTDDAETTTDAA